jgi:hypothetical protein
MRPRASILVLIALVTFATIVRAGAPGINLSWNACATDVASSQRCYTCDGHAGITFVFQGSFRPAHSIPDFAGCISTVNVTFMDAGGDPLPIPDFWRSGDCAVSDYHASDPDTVGGCEGFLFGSTNTGFAVSDMPPATVQLRIDWAGNPPAPVPLVAGSLYPGFAFTMDADGAVNTGCQGCASAALIQVTKIEVYGFSLGEDEPISAQDQRNWVRWQGTSSNPCSMTPTRNATWGAIKAMYR